MTDSWPFGIWPVPGEDPPLWHLVIANAPWFGWCKGTCGRELGMTKEDRYIRPYGELVAFQPADPDRKFYCMSCVTEVVRTDWLRADEEEAS